MSAPELLVIGAMKCGTTTMHGDLAAQSSLHVGEKEFGGLHRLDVLGTGPASYLAQWRGSRGIGVDVSATYSMFPEIPGVPQAAAAACPNARVLYIVRDPLRRIASHHHHEVSAGTIGSDLDRAVRQDRRFLDYSRYWTQLQRWREFFDDEALHVIRFEDYVANRNDTIRAVLSWLGSEADLDVSSSAARNVGDQGRVTRGVVRRFAHSDLYRIGIRPLLPRLVRHGLRSALTHGRATQPAPPSAETARWLVEQLKDEIEELTEWTRGAVCWDLGETVRAWVEDK